MRKIVATSVLAASLAATPANAWYGGWGPYGGMGYGGWGYGEGWGYGGAMIGAAAGGALLGGVIGGAIANANRPVYAPAPVYAAPPVVVEQPPAQQIIINNGPNATVVRPAPVVAPVVVAPRPRCRRVRFWDSLFGWEYQTVCD